MNNFIGGVDMERTWLTQLRKQKKLTLKEASKLSECGFSYLCDIEKGRRTPSIAVMYRISKVVGFSMEQYINEEIKSLINLGEIEDKAV